VLHVIISTTDQLVGLETSAMTEHESNVQILAAATAVFTSASMTAVAAHFPSPLEFYTLAAREELLKNNLQEHFQSYRTKIGQLVTQGISDGEFRSQNGEDVANTIIALFEGVLLMWAIAPESIDLRTQAETAVSLLLEGLQT
jgi:hypothetical protein